MSGYWDERFGAEGRIWGDAPGATAALAEEAFRRAGARTVLVPGAGYGRNAELFSRAGYGVTGVEISGEALRLAPVDSTATYVQGSILDVDLPRGAFDAVYCFNVLHLFRLASRRAFLEKCLGALKPGGMAFFVVFSDREPQFGRGSEVEEGTFESKPGRPVHFYTDAGLRAELAGWEILETGSLEEHENHGSEGPHVHELRYIMARKRASDFDGDAYAKASTHQKEWGRRMAAELELKGDERILDLGCGDGALTAEIAAMAPRGSVLGIDSSPGMIETARKRAGGNLSVELMDIGVLSFMREFDLIFSNATLHWVKDHRRLLGSCSRALRDGGRLRFNFAGRGNCPRFISSVRSVMESGGCLDWFRGFAWPWFMPGVEEYEGLVKECGGFSAARVWEENADRFFTREELVRWIDQPSIVPFLAPIPEQDREAFRRAVREKTLAATLEEGGRHFEAFRRINLCARR